MNWSSMRCLPAAFCLSVENHPLAGRTEIYFEELEEYPCLSFEQGEQNSFYFAEEVFSTREYKRIIKADDRATLLNLMVGLNGYTLCSGIICRELNGNEYTAVPLRTEDVMHIGYIKKKKYRSVILVRCISGNSRSTGRISCKTPGTS